LVVATTGLWFFTGLLWRTTTRAVQGEEKAISMAAQSAAAADLHARAVVALQLPILSATPQPPVDRDMEPVGVDGRLPKTFAIHEARVRNDGNTSATPIDLRWGWQVAAVLPPDPVYAETRIPGSEKIIAAGNAEGFPVYLSITLTDTQHELIGERRTHFWLYTSIRFFDFMGMKRETGACWRWQVQSVIVDEGISVIREMYDFSPMAWNVPPAYIRKNLPCDEPEH
jgi:hypothetical protein